MEAGTFSRPSWNEATEDDFSKFLGDLEELALPLQSGTFSTTQHLYVWMGCSKDATYATHS